ncbi:LPXTG cell wall anchor domain-containing protein [Xylanimonas allomyrinae]|uniref:LPXTG cell wall anchor domain-containing protein n=2 Tax=Xylanimonas allomyrinae TaxID=2509459 RepID=A0A4P6F3B6_9MICO|nr:LPXTG cell wall anchor domain-containing protein [Xylanimonas allomyrinae]
MSSLALTVLDPICDGDVPYLRYAVVPTGTPNTTVTITWLNPNGPDVVLPNLPLTGRVRWPGAEVDAQGRAVDWPGWRLEGDTWVEGDEYDWVRPSVDVKFVVNPEATTTVAYPPSSPSCSTNPPGSTPMTAQAVSHRTAALPRTGTEALRLALVAAGLLVLGTAAVVLTRRRRA